MPKRQTIQEFVEKAQLLHGSKYDYSKVIYKDSTTEVIIGCPLHGPYLITPKRHIAIRHSRSESKPQGCPKCGEEKRRMNVGKSAKTRVKTSEQFIIDAKKVHGEKYCYKKALYKSAHSHVIITCKIHGDFSQKAYSHLNGKGCPECGLKVVRETANKKKGISMPRKGMTVAWNQETFIAKCTEIHRGKYYYTKTIFTTTNRNIIYECKKHGLCTQMASEHLRGRGCERCGRDMIGLARRMKFDQWEKIAKTTHGDQYEYDQASYKTTKHPIRIRCKIHGWFSQSAGLHAYAGIGCNQCGNESISESRTRNKETLLRQCRSAHGDFYDYSKIRSDQLSRKVIYEENGKIQVICKEHGLFLVHPNNHIFLRQGCPSCSASKGEVQVRNYLDLNQIEYVYQWTDHDCIDKARLRFDFFLPTFNAVVEFDGQQHFAPTSFHGAMTIDQAVAKFEDTLRKDRIKEIWCSQNSVRMVRIKYLDDIEAVMMASFNKSTSQNA